MIDDEKVPEYSLREFVYGGTRISSRYNKFHEVKAMVRALDAVNQEPWRGSIMSIFCDSKACATYSVECVGVDALLQDIALTLGEAFFERNGGLNGLVVKGQSAPDAWVDPMWQGDELFSV